MGLIKTAVISGVALYGIKQVANVAEHRQSSASSLLPRNMDYDANYDQRRSWNAGSDAPYDRRRALPASPPEYYDGYPQSQQQQQQRSATPEYSSYAPNDSKYGYCTSQNMLENDPRTFDRTFDGQERGPPQYQDLPPRHYRTQPQRGFVEPYDAFEPQYERGHSSGGDGNALIDQAMSFVQSQGSGRKGKKSSLGDFVTGLMEK